MFCVVMSMAQSNNVIDEVAWVVGDEPIYKSDIEIGEWNEMNELFSKTLRYKLLNSLIPQINNSIQYFSISSLSSSLPAH